MASWSWTVGWERQGQNLADFPHLKRWFDTIGERPAVKKGRAVGEELRSNAPMDDEAKKHLFNQK